jgi:hypothetical protein
LSQNFPGGDKLFRSCYEKITANCTLLRKYKRIIIFCEKNQRFFPLRENSQSEVSNLGKIQGLSSSYSGNFCLRPRVKCHFLVKFNLFASFFLYLPKKNQKNASLLLEENL